MRFVVVPVEAQMRELIVATGSPVEQELPVTMALCSVSPQWTVVTDVEQAQTALGEMTPVQARASHERNGQSSRKKRR